MSEFFVRNQNLQKLLLISKLTCMLQCEKKMLVIKKMMMMITGLKKNKKKKKNRNRRKTSDASDGCVCWQQPSRREEEEDIRRGTEPTAIITNSAHTRSSTHILTHNDRR
ncbi:hypothetical protein GCK72_018926 [Caenorhabditis remanei]|uniref:Uncharacterized protein n=1 Tax=Caenorhabditis remanei TaxID=31234 RepID=A0A6A5GD51_CAERE|nr:hypothetical protein GCK72_018926 [Caenorhabditis remanei]KAF1752372.1 hypothetical protein GCK72_018926 [Caenorhabditis remanei]